MSVDGNKNVFVRVKIDEKFQFVTVNTEENDVKSFLTSGKGSEMNSFIRSLHQSD